MLVSRAALLQTSAGFFADDLYNFRTSMVRNLGIQAQIIVLELHLTKAWSFACFPDSSIPPPEPMEMFVDPYPISPRGLEQEWGLGFQEFTQLGCRFDAD